MNSKSARKYFSYVAKQFPVMCASGAFPLMPPATEAGKWLDRFDDLSQKGIAKHVTKLTRFKNDFMTAEAKATTLEEQAQARALALSVGGVITELNSVRAWEKNPEIYLKIAFTGLEQAATMPAKSEKTRQKHFLKRLKKDRKSVV